MRQGSLQMAVQEGELLGLLTRASIGNFIEQRHSSK
ncbi:MAG: hypothetical protein K0S58_1330 [Nitrospira sp.]|jgi:hypothetical protein|nr:hypothetical protein [Nitrospira sp.]